MKLGRDLLTLVIVSAFAPYYQLSILLSTSNIVIKKVSFVHSFSLVHLQSTLDLLQCNLMTNTTPLDMLRWLSLMLETTVRMQ